MTILYLLTKDPGSTGEKILAEHKKKAEVTVIDLRHDKDYDKIVDQIAACDKIISW